MADKKNKTDEADLLFLRRAVTKRKEKLIRANDQIHDYAELS